MNIENSNVTVEQMSKTTPVLGILSIVFGGLSMLPLLGIVSPIGLILGIVALVKKQKITGVIGTSISVLGVVTSPILWALVTCTVNPDSEACQAKTTTEISQPASTSNVETAPAAQPISPETSAPVENAVEAAPADAAQPDTAPVETPATEQAPAQQ